MDLSKAVKSLIEIRQPEIFKRILEQNNFMEVPIKNLNEDTIILFWEVLLKSNKK